MEEQVLSASNVVRLMPPKLHAGGVLKKAVCVRPMRDGRFNISTSRSGSKQIVHCYGMGGSGWTTLFGSIGKAIALFQDVGADKKTPIRVIGAGCMGLTAAIELKRLGYAVAGITAKDLYDMPSWRAAGYFAFVSIQTSPDEQANLEQIGIETFKAYHTIYTGLHPYITRETVRYLPVYGSKGTELGLDALEAHGHIPPREEVTLDFGNVRHEGYVKYMTYFMETTAIMKQLRAEVTRLGIPIEVRKVCAWDEVREEIIFNCSGLGARELNNDSCMIPVRGHLLLLDDPPQESCAASHHMDYLIYTKVKQGGVEESIYLFPKALAVCPEEPDGACCHGVLGGTFISHADRLSPRELEQLDEEEFKKMFARSSQFFYGKL